MSQRKRRKAPRERARKEGVREGVGIRVAGRGGRMQGAVFFARGAGCPSARGEGVRGGGRGRARQGSDRRRPAPRAEGGQACGGGLAAADPPHTLAESAAAGCLGVVLVVNHAVQLTRRSPWALTLST